MVSIVIAAVIIALAVQKEVWTNWTNEILSQRYTEFWWQWDSRHI